MENTSKINILTDIKESGKSQFRAYFLAENYCNQ